MMFPQIKGEVTRRADVGGPPRDLRGGARAARLLRPDVAPLIHYGTFPVLRGTPQEYQQLLGQTTTQVFPISPGDELTF